MRKGKKLLSVLLACVLVFAMSITAFASEYVITVENSVTGSIYYAYKVLDATYNSDGNVAYTISSDSEWYSLVSGTTTVYSGGSEVTNPFNVTETTVSGKYNVTLKKSMTSTEIAAWFNAITATQLSNAGIDTSDAKTSETGNGGEIELDVGEAGYYYVTTTTGSVVTLTSADPTAEIIDKNLEPGDLEKTVNDAEVEIGDSATYTITADIPAYDGTTQITEYKFVDTLPTGLTAPEATNVTVKILDGSGKVYAYLTSATTTTIGTDSVNAIVVNSTNNTITVDFNPTDTNISKTNQTTVETGGDSLLSLSSCTSYPSDATIVITYSAVVNSSAVYENENTVTMTWTNESTGEEDKEKVYTYGFNLKKVVKGETDTLYGAEFTLTDDNGSTIGFIPYDSDDHVLYISTTGANAGSVVYSTDGGTTETVSSWENVSKYVVSTDATATGYTTTIYVGAALIWGLDADTTYTLTETVAPDGYNLLDAGVEVTVGQRVGVAAQYDTNGVNNETTTIENTAGTEMPETGGIGTTVFYIVGGVLILGALILLVTRRRMKRVED